MEQASSPQYFGFPQKHVRARKKPRPVIQWVILVAILVLAIFEVYWFVFRNQDNIPQPTQVVTYLEVQTYQIFPINHLCTFMF
ncbi:hypothetical protein [Dyadobacter sandarakinus]|uniref:Uncharacterized protein n=1 Tax=Dyadobacter sandarakinus TaxID=2747268 RepID=A0ABX7I924_9BACT|nr:hypothetical protein [Dyadobacter sandarakinus]QRR02611.1 hypothetical protein HWI92_17680 [Dyadobacter sandarakinus]